MYKHKDDITMEHLISEILYFLGHFKASSGMVHCALAQAQIIIRKRALDDYTKGKITLNDMRQKCGLDPIECGSEYFVKISETMNIHEAIEKAMPLGKGIRRQSWRQHDNPTMIIPTNTSSGFIMDNLESKNPARRWQPKAEDIIADDWEITG